MKMWSLRVIILLLFCYACLSSCNGRVRFVSTNFYSTLQWDAAEPATAGRPPLYTVKYKTYEDNSTFQTKAECQNILTLTCDLTAQTPSKYSVHYLALVLVDGVHYGYAMRFNPIADTHLGPPVLAAYATASSLHVNVTLPLGPNNISVGDIIRGTRNPHFKTEIIYTLRITEPAWAEHSFVNTNGSFAIHFGKKAAKFCGFVVYSPSSGMGRHQSDNASFCVPVQHEEGNPLRLLPWLLVPAALLAVLLILAVLYAWHYVKGGKGVKTPETLKITFGAESMQPPDRNLTICKVDVRPPDEERPYRKIEKARNPPPSDGYCPQDVPSHQPGTSNSGSGSSSSRQSSVIYSTVDVQKQEAFQQTDGSNLPLLPSVTDGAGPKSPCPNTFDSSPDTHPWTLLVDATRDGNGKLILMEFGSEGEAQRRPLLRDLECCGTDWTRVPSSDDSDCDDSAVNTPTQPYCNNHYRPPGPQGDGDVLTSGYRPNCIPANFIQPKCGFKDTGMPYSQTWSGLKQAGDDEEDEAQAGEEVCSPSEIPLSLWMVQVQD